MLKLKRDFPYEFCIRDKSGNTKWILETATPIRYKGKRAGLGYFMDVTRSKQLEDERLKEEKLRSIVEMAAAVGHELNNPLQVVLTCAQKLSPDANDTQREDRLSGLLLDNIEKMRGIIVKFQNITRYATKNYVAGKKIIDIDGASIGQQESDAEVLD
jgi:nitrogen-specific signal transduction histidine kinase